MGSKGSYAHREQNPGANKQVRMKDTPAYAKLVWNFGQKYSIFLLESNLQLLLAAKSRFVGSRALNFAIEFITAAVKQENAMEKLKPFME